MTNRILVSGFFAGLFGAQQAQQTDWLAICNRCPSPTVFRKTGTGTANSVAEAKMAAKEFEGFCAEQGFKGAALAKCVKDELAGDGGKIYRASANCLAGTLSAADGRQYTFAGVWSNDDIGGGRTKWRNTATGEVVGRDNASGGLALSQQWEVLCPGPLKITRQVPSARPGVQAPVQAAVRQAPPPPPVCNGAPQCTEVNSFAATITDFRTSTAGAYRIVTASIRFQNKLDRPLILGYLSGSGVAIDDRGNRFEINENTGLRGMGFIRANQVDPKFLIGAGQAADARVEYAWYPRGGEIFGTQYDLEFSLREIVPVSPTQFRVSLEHPLKWSALRRPEVSASPAAQPSAAVAASPAPVDAAAAVAAPVDYCQGLDRCYSAQLFTAQVQQVTSSTVMGGYQALTFRLRFRNVTTQPLVLAYKNGTSVAIDNNGHRYGQRGANFVRGMGVSGGGHANADFVIQPGQTRDASFEVQRYVVGTPVGTGFTWDVAVEQLELLPANQLRTVREFSLNFPDLTAANPVAGAAPVSGQQVNEAAKKLKDIFKRRR
jgi:hypothetical protein